MKKIILLSVLTVLLASCSASKSSNATTENLETELNEKNRGNLSLLTRIRQLPGVALKYGVPVVVKNSNSLSAASTEEPLYVLNGQIIGNSFKSINDIVDNFNVKSVKLLKESESSFYGVQAASGVITITTYQ